MSKALVDLFDGMTKRFKKGVLDKSMTFYFSLGDAEGQKWILNVSPTECSAKPGKTDKADVILKTSEELFLKLIKGEWVPGTMDFMRGKIKSNDPFALKVLKDAFV
jgi:putative sterol carrier protein